MVVYRTSRVYLGVCVCVFMCGAETTMPAIESDAIIINHFTKIIIVNDIVMWLLSTSICR